MRRSESSKVLTACPASSLLEFLVLSSKCTERAMILRLVNSHLISVNIMLEIIKEVCQETDQPQLPQKHVAGK